MYRWWRVFVRMSSMNIMIVLSGTRSTIALLANSSVRLSDEPMPHGSKLSSLGTRGKASILFSPRSRKMCRTKRIARTHTQRSSTMSSRWSPSSLVALARKVASICENTRGRRVRETQREVVCVALQLCRATMLELSMYLMISVQTSLKGSLCALGCEAMDVEFGEHALERG